MGLRHVSGAMVHADPSGSESPVGWRRFAPVKAFDGVVGDPDLHLFLDS